MSPTLSLLLSVARFCVHLQAPATPLTVSGLSYPRCGHRTLSPVTRAPGLEEVVVRALGKEQNFGCDSELCSRRRLGIRGTLKAVGEESWRLREW